MKCGDFGELGHEQIKAVLQLTYQLIAGANYGFISEKDDSSINVMMQHLGLLGSLWGTLGNAYWNEAMDNPFEAFDIVSKFDSGKKKVFRDAIIAVSKKDNSFLRLDIARQIFKKIGI